MKVKNIIIIAFLCIAAIVSAQNKTALLIANSNYSSFSSLENPVPEAIELKKTLESLDFDVVLLANASREQILEEITAFEERLRIRKGIAFFHYGGHAVQVNGRNYLIPADAEIPDERRVVTRAVDSDEILSAMESAGSDTNIVIMDSCRNNPLPAGTGRTASRGLAMAQSKPPNSVIVYSAESGTVALDGIFTPTLIQILKKPGISLQEILMQTRKLVYEKTNGAQIPGEYNQLFQPVFLSPEIKKYNEIVFDEDRRYYASITVRLKTAGTLSVLDRDIAIPADGHLALKGLSIGNYDLKVTYADGYEEKMRITLDRELNKKITFNYIPLEKLNNMYTYVQAGTFVMGSPINESNHDSDEMQHQVTLTRNFMMAQVEVTQGLWEEVMGSTVKEKAEAVGVSRPLLSVGDQYPMYYVNWYDALEFCNKLSEKEGLTPCYDISVYKIECNFDADGYRLPTEAEWEFAARGGLNSFKYKMYAGSEIIDDYARYNLNSSGRPQYVGSKEPNELGLYDLSGNVNEWCWDMYAQYEKSVKDPQGPKDGYKRVFRGGSFFDASMDIRVANRQFSSPGMSGEILGFRLVRTVP